MNAADSVAAAAEVTVASEFLWKAIGAGGVINMLRRRTTSMKRINKNKEELGKFRSKRYYVLQLCNVKLNGNFKTEYYILVKKE